jgi:nitrogenase molybdenum-iron protein beta chain
LVNVFASVPYQDPFWKGNLSELKRILEGIGLKVNILFGQESRGVAEWKTIPQASFNILVSPWYGLEIVEHLQEKYGQPFFRFPYIPIGGNETTRFLRELAAFAELDPAKVEAFIKREEEAFYLEIQSLASFLLEFRYGLPAYTQILHDSSYVLGIYPSSSSTRSASCPRSFSSPTASPSNSRPRYAPSSTRLRTRRASP